MAEPDRDPVKWTVSAPGSLDRALRSYLASTGTRKGDLSRFVVEAVRWRLAERNVTAAREQNAGADPAALESEIDRALADVRAARFARPL